MSSNEIPPYILVVDDKGAIRYSITKTLQRLGFTVSSAASGEEAMALLESKEFEVVLTDIRMPGISGVDLLAFVRDKYPDTSVILMTGYASLNTAVESLRLGANDYLVKPSSSRDIRESVTRGVERALSMRRRRRLLDVIQAGVEELSSESLAQGTGLKHVALTDIEQGEDGNDSNATLESLAAMELGPLTLFPGRYQIAVDDNTIDLTPTEFDLLLYLAAHRGRVVPCAELVREVRGYNLGEEEAREVMRPHVSNLRRKIKVAPHNVDLIINVRGIGYRLADLE